MKHCAAFPTAGLLPSPSSPEGDCLQDPAGPLDVLETRLRFALDHDGVDLGLLAAIFSATAPGEIASIVRRKPTGVFARRLWYLYEWLTLRRLDVPEPAGRLQFVPVLDPGVQVALKAGTPSGRHRVIDNLPGTRRFCPMVWWTPALRTASAKGWDIRARAIIACTHPHRRPSVATWLQRADARSSFVLAGETPSGARTVRWADAIGQAGLRTLTLDELLRLQRIVCGDRASVRLGLRPRAWTSSCNTEDGAGDGARAEDLDDLVGGLTDYAERAVCGAEDPVIAAAALAFGFGCIRPFVTGNGHIQRWLVHHTLDAAGYTPPGFVLPISAAMVRRIDEYRAIFASYAAGPPSADAYRFADMTTHAEFLYGCLEDCIDKELHLGASLVAVRRPRPRRLSPMA